MKCRLLRFIGVSKKTPVFLAEQEGSTETYSQSELTAVVEHDSSNVTQERQLVLKLLLGTELLILSYISSPVNLYTSSVCHICKINNICTCIHMYNIYIQYHDRRNQGGAAPLFPGRREPSPQKICCWQLATAVWRRGISDLSLSRLRRKIQRLKLVS